MKLSRQTCRQAGSYRQQGYIATDIYSASHNVSGYLCVSVAALLLVSYLRLKNTFAALMYCCTALEPLPKTVCNGNLQLSSASIGLSAEKKVIGDSKLYGMDRAQA